MSEAHALSAGAAAAPFVAREVGAAEHAIRGIAPGTLVHGRNRFFSYDASALADQSINSCGQQAIATMLDFWDAAQFGLPRNYRGKGDADDGCFHHPPQYVQMVMQAFPPTSLLGHTFSTWENLNDAFVKCGLTVGRIHSAAFGDGVAEESQLRDWIATHRLPAVCLIDNISWRPDGELHWGIICGWSDQQVLMASWGQIVALSWQQFREGWHCPGLPWQNNYLALFPYRPA